MNCKTTLPHDVLAEPQIERMQRVDGDVDELEVETFEDDVRGDVQFAPKLEELPLRQPLRTPAVVGGRVPSQLALQSQQLRLLGASSARTHPNFRPSPTCRSASTFCYRAESVGTCPRSSAWMTNNVH